MAKWFLAHGVDGFPIQPAYLPGGLDDFVDLVIPELQERSLFRAEYEGTKSSKVSITPHTPGTVAVSSYI